MLKLRRQSNMLGSIEFVRGRSVPKIDLWADHVARVVGAHGHYLLLGGGAPRLRLEMGRLLGRSLAHELGHYLLGTKGHTEMGLMRAHYDASDARVSVQSDYTLNGNQVAALNRTLSAWRTQPESPRLTEARTTAARRSGAALRSDP
jgi:hypothetical protein